MPTIPPPSTPDWVQPIWTRYEAAESAKISVRTLERAVTAGKITRHKIGRLTRYRPVDVMALAKPQRSTEDAQIAEYVAALADSAPRLTAEQRATISAALAAPHANGGAA